MRDEAKIELFHLYLISYRQYLQSNLYILEGVRYSLIKVIFTNNLKENRIGS